jgi:hypothetical protein
MRRRHWVVVTVLLLGGLVVALLLPAIERVREAAARMMCHSHLKQMAVGIHGYSDAAGAGSFPSGTVPQPSLPPDERLSWYVPILPHIEQDKVFRQFDLAVSPNHPANQLAVSHRFRHLVCPSSGEYERTDDGVTWKSPTPLTHYIGVAGVGADAAIHDATDRRTGVFGYDRRTKCSEEGIPDGLSNTLLVIETGSNPGHWAHGGPATCRGFEPETAPYTGQGRPFGGFHSDGSYWRESRFVTTASLADGSVRSISASIAPEVLEALATVGGKEQFPADW